MLEVDKGGRDDECNKNPISDRDLPRKGFPNNKKEQGREQFDRQIAKSDSCPAIGAASTQCQPANERQILVPWNLRFAGRTKGAARLVDGKIQWEPINADVEKRSDAGAENEGEPVQQMLVD